MPLRKIAHSNNRGFTLIEFLAAIVILMVGLLALLQSVNVAIVTNLSNQYRNDALNLADERLAIEMAKPFILVSTVTTSRVQISRPINNAFKNYSVVRSGARIPGGYPEGDDAVFSKVVNIHVSWRHKGNRYEHNMSGMVSRSLSNSPNVR